MHIVPIGQGPPGHAHHGRQYLVDVPKHARPGPQSVMDAQAAPASALPVTPQARKLWLKTTQPQGELPPHCPLHEFGSARLQGGLAVQPPLLEPELLPLLPELPPEPPELLPELLPLLEPEPLPELLLEPLLLPDPELLPLDDPEPLPESELLPDPLPELPSTVASAPPASPTTRSSKPQRPAHPALASASAITRTRRRLDATVMARTCPALRRRPPHIELSAAAARSRSPTGRDRQ